MTVGMVAVMAVRYLVIKTDGPEIGNWGPLYRKIFEFSSFDSSMIRLGMSIRGLQLIGDSFPIGVGRSFEHAALAAQWIPLFRPDHAWIFREFPPIFAAYQRVATAGTVTEIQIQYVSFVVAYGLLGLISMLVFIAAAAINLRWAMRPQFKRDPNWFIASALWSILLIYGVFFFFNTSPTLYAILVPVFHGTFLVANSRNAPTLSDAS